MNEGLQIEIARAYRQLGDDLHKLAGLIIQATGQTEDIPIKQEPDVIPLTAEEFKRIKKIRDPLKPKKSLTAYNLFVKDIIPQLKRQEKGGNKGVGSLAAEFAERWRDLPEDQKETYQEKARQLRENYLEKLEEYKKYRAENPFDPLTVEPKKRRKRGPKPKETAEEPEELSEEYEDNVQIKLKEPGDEHDLSTSPETKPEPAPSSEEENEAGDSDATASEEERKPPKIVPPKVPKKQKESASSKKKKRANGDAKESPKKTKKHKK